MMTTMRSCICPCRCAPCGRTKVQSRQEGSLGDWAMLDLQRRAVSDWRLPDAGCMLLRSHLRSPSACAG